MSTSSTLTNESYINTIMKNILTPIIFKPNFIQYLLNANLGSTNPEALKKPKVAHLLFNYQLPEIGQIPLTNILKEYTIFSLFSVANMQIIQKLFKIYFSVNGNYQMAKSNRNKSYLEMSTKITVDQKLYDAFPETFNQMLIDDEDIDLNDIEPNLVINKLIEDNINPGLNNVFNIYKNPELIWSFAKNILLEREKISKNAISEIKKLNRTSPTYQVDKSRIIDIKETKLLNLNYRGIAYQTAQELETEIFGLELYLDILQLNQYIHTLLEIRELNYEIVNRQKLRRLKNRQKHALRA